MSLKIDHITFAPTGGAGIVASTLADFQKRMGLDAKLYTAANGGLRSNPLAHPLLTAAASIDELVIKAAGNKSMLSHIRRRASLLQNLPLREHSMVHLHWIEGVITHEQVRNLLDKGRKVVWTLHDEAPFTGGCHSSLGCKNYQGLCSDCPAVRPMFAERILQSHESLVQLGLGKTSIGLVAPSNWLKNAAESSNTFRGQTVTVIRNPISVDYFSAPARDVARRELGIESNEFVGVMIAAQLDNPIKQARKFAEVFFQITDKLGTTSKLLFIGAKGRELERVHSQARWVGELTPPEISRVLAAADFLASASLAESAGMTVKEAAAIGIPAIAMRSGGAQELVEDGRTGFIVEDFEHFQQKVLYLAQNPEQRFALGRAAKKSAMDAHPAIVAEKYVQFYESLV